MKNKTVMPKQAAPVERNYPATAGAGAEKGGVLPSQYNRGPMLPPFAGDDAE